MRYSLTGERSEGYLPLGDLTSLPPRDSHLRVEYQSVRRLPQSGMLVFTIHTYSDPLRDLARAPKAAAVLRLALLALDGAKRKYRGMTDAYVDSVVEYLGQLAAACR